MNANEYQVLANRTLVDSPPDVYADYEIMLVWNAIGLAGEAGEVANLIKKYVFHQHDLDFYKVADELGDVLWYVAALCTEIGWTLDEVMEHNINKLRKRYPDGFSTQDSINRSE